MAFYRYLNEYCNIVITSGDYDFSYIATTPLPDKKISHVIKQKIRARTSYEMFSFEGNYWGFDRWEKEIDFMAMHGINVAFQPIGFDGILYRTLREIGMKEEIALDFSSGPAFLMRQLTGNVAGFNSVNSAEYLERKIIEERLNEGCIITDIADELHRNKSSIKREIDRHIVLVFPSTFNDRHPCIKKDSCPVKSFNCYTTCKNLEISLCPKLISSPHICNHCNNKKGCRYVKKYYKANEANCEYINSWKEDRTGMHYTEDELRILNTDFYLLVIRTKSIYHSLKVINNRGFNFNKRTIYNQIKNNNLKLKYSDLQHCVTLWHT